MVFVISTSEEDTSLPTHFARCVTKIVCETTVGRSTYVEIIAMLCPK